MRISYHLGVLLVLVAFWMNSAYAQEPVWDGNKVVLV